LILMRDIVAFSRWLETLIIKPIPTVTVWWIQGTDSDKVRFMILERGPWAFFQGVSRLVRSCFWEVSPAQGLFSAAASRISERVRVLTDLRTRLATLIGQVIS
jgi:nuclear-control-of-ATPase protein 2